MKIAITERQLKTVKKLLNENYIEESFTKKVKLSFSLFNYNNLNREIEDIQNVEIDLKYQIDLLKTTHGYGDYNIHTIEGPETVTTTIEYYEGDSDDLQTEEITFNIEWDKAKVRYEGGAGELTLADTVEVYVLVNENDEPMVRDVNVIGLTY